MARCAPTGDRWRVGLLRSDRGSLARGPAALRRGKGRLCPPRGALTRARALGPSAALASSAADGRGAGLDSSASGALPPASAPLRSADSATSATAGGNLLQMDNARRAHTRWSFILSGAIGGRAGSPGRQQRFRPQLLPPARGRHRADRHRGERSGAEAGGRAPAGRRVEARSSPSAARMPGPQRGPARCARKGPARRTAGALPPAGAQRANPRPHQRRGRGR